MRHEGHCCFHPFDQQPFGGMNVAYCCYLECKDVSLVEGEGREEKAHGYRECSKEHAPRFSVRLIDGEEAPS